MEAQVAVSDLTNANPKTPFIVFGTVKNPKKTPGVVVTTNPYAAAVKFAMKRNAKDKDIEKTAEQIVDEIVNHAHKLRENTNSDSPSS